MSYIARVHPTRGVYKKEKKLTKQGVLWYIVNGRIDFTIYNDVCMYVHSFPFLVLWGNMYAEKGRQ